MRELFIASMGEMALKGLNRKSFEAVLLKNIRGKLTGLGSWNLRSSQSTVYIEPQDALALQHTQEAFSRCMRVFGIAAFTRAAVCEKTMESIRDTTLAYLGPQLKKSKSFKVTAKRADKSFPLNSLEISRELGGQILSAFPHLKVDVHTPEVLVVAEVRETAAYVHTEKQRGPGGLPVHTSGRAAVLLSGGIDSPVAAWQMAKRGLGLVAVHFASPPYTGPRAAEKVRTLAQKLSTYVGPFPYYLVKYTKTQEYLRDNLRKQEYFTVLMRRSMLRIASQLAQKEGAEALITGESLAQVASQTLLALAATDEAQALPVLRPCIGMDKLEITKIARTIDTFETSILPYEDCCTLFTPPHPKTKPKLAEIHALEAHLGELASLEQAALEELTFELIRPES